MGGIHIVTEPSATSSPRPRNDVGEPGRDSVARRGTTTPPVLASEILREDVAPLRPWDRAFRVWDIALGLAVVLAGVAVHAGMVPSSPIGAWISYAIGAALIGLGMAPLPYTARGTGSLLLGMLTVGLGLARLGPLDGLVAADQSPIWATAKVMAATALPAALLFRARYRAYLGARVALLVALAVALPAAANAGMTVAAGPLYASIAAGLTLVAILTSLLGFMGEGTTGASTAWAVFVVAIFGAELMARSLWLGTGWTAYLVDIRSGLMLMVACIVTSKGLFQLLAAAFADDARRVDVLRKPAPSMHRLDAAD